MGPVVSLAISILQVFNFILLARVLMSWFPNLDRSNPTIDTIVTFILNITEPVLAPIRRVLPQTGMIDFSPLLVFFGVQLLIRFLMAAA